MIPQLVYNESGLISEIKVFNDGFVRVRSVLGTDLDIADVARVSFGKKAQTWTEKEEKLVNYLWQHGHTSPFRHSFISLNVKLPIFIARQWEKYKVGSPIDTPENEISGRYVEWAESFWHPLSLRKHSAQNKQGSEGYLSDESEEAMLLEVYRSSYLRSYAEYELLLKHGVAKEQARALLPQGLYTEMIWTPSLQALIHFLQQRLDTHAQLEIQIYARCVLTLVYQYYPHALTAVFGESLKDLIITSNEKPRTREIQGQIEAMETKIAYNSLKRSENLRINLEQDLKDLKNTYRYMVANHE